MYSLNMNKRILIISTACLLLLHVNVSRSGMYADNKLITEDSEIIAKGEAVFNLNCSGCHNFRQDGIGPQLGGLTTEVSAEWIRNFVKNPQKVIHSGDERAQQLFKKYKVVMPSFNVLTNDELKQIIAFLKIQKLPNQKVIKETGKELANPVPDKIKSSDMVVELKQAFQFPASSDSSKLPLTRITKLDVQPNTANLFVLDLRGRLYKIQNNKPVVYMDMAKLRPAFINEPGLATGFGSFAFHPRFAKNGLMYTTHTEPPGSAKADFSYADSIKVALQWVLTEWKADNPCAAVFSGTGRELLRINMVTGIHGVQEITFNPLATPGNEDYGFLYIGVGDGGSVEEGYPFLAHSTEKIWGTVLRINPGGKNSANGHYGIPPQNPFAKMLNTKKVREIFAYGFRNPHRITWSKQGQMLVSNIGHGNIESIDLVVKGHDYGWPVREGSFVLHPDGDLNKVYALRPDDSIYHITYPIAQYDHDEGKAISGGFEYTGSAVPKLKGKYLFGDIPTGRLLYINTDDIKQGRQAVIKEWNVSVNGTIRTIRELCGSERADIHFGKDLQGELYLLTKPDGKVYKLINTK